MIVVDIGPLVAAADADDDYHESCRPFLERHAHELVVPSSVIVEACWLVSSTTVLIIFTEQFSAPF